MMLNNFITSQKPLRPFLLAALLSGPVCGFAVFSEAIASADLALADYSLEQLMDMRVEVTSAGRKAQKLEDTATAIYVIDREDIRRSGMTTIPELLRRVPGLQVAQINGNTAAIGSRGFNQRYSNKLLVLLDGRTLYTPTFSGVFWDAQDVVLEDIERIEVIRGPGGTLWGANAVNGVINIITQSAAATQGGMVNAGFGNYERQGAVRYGGEIGETGHYRIYAKRIGQDNSPLGSTLGGGAPAHDRRNMGSAGFRADWALPGGDTVMAQGGVYDGNADQTLQIAQLSPPAMLPLDFTTAQRSGNLSMNWKHALSVSSEWSLKFYYDYYQRRGAGVSERRDTGDVDFQHRFLLAENHDVMWGLGYRQTSDELNDAFIVSFLPPRRRDNTVSAFFQDEIALGQGNDRDKVHLILGSKFERNDYSGFEYQPNLRLRWTLDERQTAWAAVSRAVRTPSRVYSDVRFNAAVAPGTGGAPTLVRIMGNPAVQSEDLLAYEAGYRVRPTERLSLDMTGFYNEYRHLMTTEPLKPFIEAGPPPRAVAPQQFQSNASATTHGLELSASWQATETWQLKAAYSWLEMRIRRDANSRDPAIEAKAGDAPRHQLQFHSRHELDARTDLDVSLYYVDKLPNQNIPAYTRVDARLGWRPQRDLELSLGARNLLDRQHPEFVSAVVGPANSEIPCSIYGAATWRF
ncbi:MAG: TonB-dependent receptor [Sideroxyarcus sp.]|nr:TonB-dependent receptor [Sideroxyarcus sp.]